MSTQKMMRELGRRLDAMGLPYRTNTSHPGHPELFITHRGGAEQRLVMASSPRDDTNRINKAMQEVRRFARKNDGKHALEEEPPAEV